MNTMNHTTESQNISLSNNSSSDNSDMYRENIIINIVFGIIALIVVIFLIIIIYYRFFKKPVSIQIIPKDSVNRISNPIYETKRDSNTGITETSI